MPTIHDQLAWEERMIAHGISRYRTQQDKAAEGSRPHETSAGVYLLRAYVLQISERIGLYLKGKHPDGRRRNKYAKLLATIDADKTAMFALKAIISTMYHPRSTQSVLLDIGRSVEDELRFSKFATDYKDYYDQTVRSWESKRTKSVSHKRKVLKHVSAEKGMHWEEWTRDTHFGVGSLVVSLLMEVCDLVEITYISRGKGRKDAMLGPTAQCIEWVMKHNAMAELGNPDKMPCIIPPEDWTSPYDGGFYGPKMRKKVPLVKSLNRGGRRECFEDVDMPAVYSAVNAMQNTGWSVNSRVAAVMREVWKKNLGIGMPPSQPYTIPPSPLEPGEDIKALSEADPKRAAMADWKATAREIHTLERERVAQNLGVSRVMRMATDMEKYDAFYYVYQCDFRGRLYSTASGLSPQGTDHGKALLQFAAGKPLGESGWYWLRVHGANKYGNDKGDYDERVSWIDANDSHIRRVADDPISNREVWQDADKPYQFLAFCFEYAAALDSGDTAAYASSLPVALDGSCNGLQHFSAMLRDAVGGAAVNLTPGDKPADIYQEVGNVCTRKLVGLRSLNSPDHGGSANWLALFKSLGEERLPRDLSKKPVMTLPYGSTQQACTETIFRWAREKAPDFFDDNTEFRHAMYLSPKLWEAISEVVVAARGAMDWLQDCAGIMAKAGHPIRYTTPLGFPVFQAVRHYTTRKIETQIGGRLQLRIATDTDKLDGRKQRQGSSPNFVHSIDATHMMMVVNAAMERGISSFAMIHDDFGTHACDIQVFQEVIRDEFVNLHAGGDLLSSFKEQHEVRYDAVLPDLPATGDLDIHAVRKSLYFFG